MSILTADPTMQAALVGLKDKTEVRDATEQELDAADIERRLQEDPVGDTLDNIMRRVKALGA